MTSSDSEEGAPQPPKRSYPLPQADPLDLSTHGFRQLLGGLGIALPPLCWLWANLLPPRETTEGLLARLWPLRSLDSVSAYYHTSAVWAFVGILVAMSLFLFTYRGYNDRRQRLDHRVSSFAGAMALLVAIFPTTPPDQVPEPVWWSPVMETIHSGAALLLFASFVVFCWFLFPTKDKRVPERTRRDRGYASLTFRQRVKKYPVYYGCGLGIVVCLVYAGIQIRRGGPIFHGRVVGAVVLRRLVAAQGTDPVVAATAAVEDGGGGGLKGRARLRHEAPRSRRG